MKTFVRKTKKTAHPILRRRSAVLPVFNSTAQRQSARIRQVLRSPRVQPKLAISRPNDRYEQEADRIADAVMRMPDPAVQRQAALEEEKDDEQIRPKFKGNAQHVPANFGSRMQALGSGRPLPRQTRNFFEPRFGRDFSRVRVHTGAGAHQLAGSINARAFTRGNDIVFGGGEYNPESFSGKRLLGHELVHVAQQQKGDSLDPVHGQIIYRKNNKKIQQRLDNLERSVKVNRILSNFNLKLTQKKWEWDVAARNVGSAYATAYGNHKKALSDQTKFDALVQSIVFGLLTTAIVGPLGGLGEFLEGKKILEELKSLKAAFEDSIQTGVGEAIDVVQAKVAPQPNPISKSPLKFQNDLLNAINQKFLYLIGLSNINNQKADKFDPEKLQKNIKKWWNASGLEKIGKAKREKERNHAMERNIWAKWMPALHKIVKKTYCHGHYLPVCHSYLIDDYTSPGQYLEKRFNELKITSEAGVNSYGVFWTSDSEIIKLIQWAQRHEVENLGMSK